MYKINLVALATLSLLVVMASSEAPEKTIYDLNKAPSLFKDFKEEHNRNYKDAEDENIHYKAFQENLKKINDLNAKSTSATYGINKFADYTPEESAGMRGLRQPAKKE